MVNIIIDLTKSEIYMIIYGMVAEMAPYKKQASNSYKSINIATSG